MESKGELAIRNILEKARIPFIQEYSPPDLTSIKNKPLRYDFAILDVSGTVDKVIALVEFDGKQHFEYVEFFSKKKQKWDYMREMDVRKNKYALMNDIPLYRIPYDKLGALNSVEDIFLEDYRIKTKWDLYDSHLNKN